MKNVTLLLLFLCTCVAVKAQPGKGQVLLNAGANGGFGSSGSDNRHHRVTAHFAGYYFLTDRLGVGLQAEGQNQMFKRQYSSSTPRSFQIDHTRFRVGPMARYYLPVGKKTAFFVQAAGGWEQRSFRSKQATLSGSGTEDLRYNYPSGAFGHITPGFAWSPTKRLALEVTAFEIGYLYRPYLYRGQHRWGVNALNAKIGATFFIGKGKEKPAVPTP